MKRWLVVVALASPAWLPAQAPASPGPGSAAAAPADYELPIAPLQWPATASRAWRWLGAGAAVVLLASVALRRRSAAASAAGPTAPPGPDLALALAELPLPGPGQEEAFCSSVKALLREACGQAIGFGAATAATSEQLLGRWPAPALRAALQPVDAVLFAAARPEGEALARARAAAVEFVRGVGGAA